MSFDDKTLDQIVSNSCEFIKYQTDPGNENELNSLLEKIKSYLSEFTIEEFEKEGSRSILVYNCQTRPEKFKVILNGHLDVIPGKESQYFPIIEGDYLYWVGAMDMKSNVACLLEVYKNMANKVDYPLWLQIVTDEEVGGFNWTKYQIENWINADFVIASETTWFDIVNKAKWIMWLKVNFYGETAHWAYPWNWTNAVLKATRFINKLHEKYPNPSFDTWQTTINISSISSSNQSFNKIPDDCEVRMDVRYTPENKDILYQDILDIAGDAEVQKIVDEPCLDVSENNEFLQFLKENTEDVIKNNIRFYGANGSSDARHFSRIGSPWVEFWPVGWWIWTDVEWIYIPSLKNYYDILEKFLLAIDE